MIATGASTNGGEIKAKVRLASGADALTLARLRYEFRSSIREVVEGDEAFVERCAAWMQERLRPESDWKCWIAECEQTTVGNVWAQLVEKIPNPVVESECYVYLTNLYVREELRRHGIGAMLLSAALAWSRSVQVQTVILWPTERSKPFYVRHGFSQAHELMQLAIE